MLIVLDEMFHLLKKTHTSRVEQLRSWEGDWGKIFYKHRES